MSILTDAVTLVRVFNLAEGVLWIAIGLGFLASLVFTPGSRPLKLAACLLFLTFGLSDFVETRTGAWYEPWWLAVWKATDILGLIVVFILYRHKRTGDAA